MSSLGDDRQNDEKPAPLPHPRGLSSFRYRIPGPTRAEQRKRVELLLVITCSPARSRGFFVMGSHEIPPAQPQSGSDWKRKRKRRSPSKRTRAAICRMKTVSLHIDRIGRVQVDRIASPCRDVQVEEREITNRADPKAKKDNSYPVFKPTRTSRTSYPKQGIVACST